MHRDTKLGLALAILVMGFAAALCFPREADENQGVLSLQTAADLDAAIRLMPAKTYTDADRQERRSTPSPLVADSPIESPGVEEVFPVAGLIDPTQVVHEPEPTPIDPSALPADILAESEPLVVHSKIYQVQPNDTLSAISKKELGNTNRWRELLDANPTLGGDPLALKHGMELIIPIPSGDEASATSLPVSPAWPSTNAVPSPPARTIGSGPPPTRSTGHFSPVPRIGSSSTSPTPQ